MDKKIEVKVIRHKNMAFLLEYNVEGIPNRVILPADAMPEEIPHTKLIEMTLNELERGQPYGIPWEIALPNREITAECLAGCLRKVGLWTYADIQSKPGAIQSALAEAIGICARDIVSIAKSAKEV